MHRSHPASSLDSQQSLRSFKKEAGLEILRQWIPSQRGKLIRDGRIGKNDGCNDISSYIHGFTLIHLYVLVQGFPPAAAIGRNRLAEPNLSSPPASWVAQPPYAVDYSRERASRSFHPSLQNIVFDGIVKA